VALVVEEIRVDGTGLAWVAPRGDWKSYEAAVLPAEGTPILGAGLSERKTGPYVPNVETSPLVRDERGWLKLVG
jgi:hypothetical protein